MARNAAERLQCAWCGADWWDGAELDVVDNAVACMRGRGCARRPDSHARRVHAPTIAGHRWRREYLLDGYWYSLQQLGDLAGIGRMSVLARLNAGWTVRDAITVPLSPSLGGGALRAARLLRLLAFVKRPRPSRLAKFPRVARNSIVASKSDKPRKCGRPARYGVSLDVIAQEFGVSRQALWATGRRAGRTVDEEIEHRRAMRAGKAA